MEDDLAYEIRQTEMEDDVINEDDLKEEEEMEWKTKSKCKTRLDYFAPTYFCEYDFLRRQINFWMNNFMDPTFVTLNSFWL